jgi:hypothetical protein
MKFINYFLGAVLVMVLTGCVTPQPLVKDVLVNPEAHLTSDFTVTKLSESVRDSLSIKTPGKVTREVRFRTVMTNSEGDNKQSYEKMNTVDVLDNGLVRRMVQTGSNGILSLTEFDLDYHGIFNLIYQPMSHRASHAYAPTYAKAISRLDKGIANPREETEYVFEYALAPEIQIVNFETQKTVCKTGKWFSANTLHAKLSGTALPIDCEYFGRNGQTFAKVQYAFIRDLGITMMRESVTSTVKRTWVITDVL